MLYRPLFAAFCNRALSPSPSGAESNIGAIFDRRCAFACFESAGKLIETTNKGIMDGLFGAWWYALFCKPLITNRFSVINTERRYFQTLSRRV